MAVNEKKSKRKKESSKDYLFKYIFQVDGNFILANNQDLLKLQEKIDPTIIETIQGTINKINSCINNNEDLNFVLSDLIIQPSKRI